MPVIISLLRAVNLGGRNLIRMEALRAICEQLGYRNPQTYLQSGNVVFRTNERSAAKSAKRLEDAIEETLGFRPSVINRTADEMQEVLARNPFAEREGIDASKLLVTFLAGDPGEEARNKVRAIPVHPEELYVSGREMFVYFQNGLGRSKIPSVAIGKALNVSGTARNWNTVTKLAQIAAGLQ